MEIIFAVLQVTIDMTGISRYDRFYAVPFCCCKCGKAHILH